MTGKERIGALMTGQLPDRVPVICNLLEQGAREMGLSIKEYYSRGEYVAEGQIRLQERYGYDQVWAFHYTAADAEMFGSEFTVFSDDGPPNVGELVLRSEADIHRLTVDDGIFDTPPFRKLIKTAEILKREKGEECLIMGTVIGSASLPPILMGMENWMDLLYSGSKGLANLLLEKCSRFCRLKTKYLMEAGIDLISYFNPLGSAAFVTADQFRREGLALVQRDLEEADTGRIVYFNGGGRINPFLDMLIENTGLRAFYINPLDSTAEAKRIINGRGLLASPINDIPLVNSTEEDVEAEVVRIMGEGAPGGGFLFGTLVMPLAIEEKMITALLKAAYKYGTY